MGDMDDNSLPNDLAECHALLMAAFKQSVELEQQVADAQREAGQAKQRATESEQKAAELKLALGDITCRMASILDCSRKVYIP